jgi:cysteine desulfurase
MGIATMAQQGSVTAMTTGGYFDANATTPLHPAAREAWLGAPWQNASGLYAPAAAARELLEDCRVRLAEVLGCGDEDIVFLSGATEANNAVLHHFAGRRVAVSAIEHPSVREPADKAAIIPAGADGMVSVAAVDELLQREKPALVSLMAANNETGALQPWAEVLERCRGAGAAFHCDAAQWLGKLPSAGLGACDYVTGSAHKFGGPKGVGFLKVDSSRGALRWLRGGPQEARQRAGTENVPGIAAMLAALEAREAQLAAGPCGSGPRDAFERSLSAAVPGVQFLCTGVPRLWNTSMFIVPPPANVKWLARLSRAGFQISTGSACSRGGGASEVLHAMGLGAEAQGRVLRVSSLWETTADDWLALAAAVVLP